MYNTPNDKRSCPETRNYMTIFHAELTANQTILYASRYDNFQSTTQGIKRVCLFSLSLVITFSLCYIGKQRLSVLFIQPQRQHIFVMK